MQKVLLITGCFGFIGRNAVDYFLGRGDVVIGVDNCSRPGTFANIAGVPLSDSFRPHFVDVRDRERMGLVLGSVCAEFGGVDAVIHLAGQVSYMKSLQDPLYDLEVNLNSTVALLEWIRQRSPSTKFIYASSNKVYGDLSGLEIEEKPMRYELVGFEDGLPSSLPLIFSGGYGCSKAAADRYVVDFHSQYGLDTWSLRQSAVTGPFQHPLSDQGWIAYLTNESLNGRTIELSGIGKQVRDVLHVKDLVNLYSRIVDSQTSEFSTEDRALNVGGGRSNALSLLELFDDLNSRSGRKTQYLVGDFRPNDQMVFVSSNVEVSKVFDWNVTVGLPEIIDQLTEIYNPQS